MFKKNNNLSLAIAIFFIVGCQSIQAMPIAEGQEAEQVEQEAVQAEQEVERALQALIEEIAVLRGEMVGAVQAVEDQTMEEGLEIAGQAMTRLGRALDVVEQAVLARIAAEDRLVEARRAAMGE